MNARGNFQSHLRGGMRGYLRSSTSRTRAIRLSGAAIPPGSKTRYDQIMRVCRLCAGPMPEIVRDDALYCSTRCKLKAQRKRTKASARQASEERPRVFEPVAPFGNVEQLSFSFMETGSTLETAATTAAEKPEAAPTPSPPAPTEPPTTPKRGSWLNQLGKWLNDGPGDKRPGQRDAICHRFWVTSPSCTSTR